MARRRRGRRGVKKRIRGKLYRCYRLKGKRGGRRRRRR